MSASDVVETALSGGDSGVGYVGDTLASYLPKIDQFYIPEWLTMQFIANNLICFTPLFSYGTTVISIARSKTALGFSIDICATMLIASVLRVSYYLITPYEVTLLKQSITMIFIQLILLRTTLMYRPAEYKYDNLTPVETFGELFYDTWLEHFGNLKLQEDWKEILKVFNFKHIMGFITKIGLTIVYKILKFFDPSYQRFQGFWQWNDDKMFWKFLLIFTASQLLFTVSVSKIFNWENFAEWIGSLIGSLGLLVESLLPLPQISILHKLKSIQGFKLILLVSWLCGDTLKITYLIFGAKNISYMFVAFALFQMSLDFYIGGQYIYYKYYYKSFRHDENIEMVQLKPFNNGDEEIQESSLGSSSNGENV